MVSIICLVVFFFATVVGFFREIKNLYIAGMEFKNVSEHEKKVYLLGDEYIFAWLCKQIIPEKANALFITNSSSNHGSANLMINYELYPRRLYLLNPDNPFMDTPPSVREIDREFLKNYNIVWIIFRYTDPFDRKLVVNLKNGQEVKRYSLNIRDRTYHAVP